VRGTDTILHVLKAKGPQFVYQKGRPPCSPKATGLPVRSPRDDSRPLPPVGGDAQGRSGLPGKPGVHHGSEIRVIEIRIVPQRKPNSRVVRDRA